MTKTTHDDPVSRDRNTVEDFLAATPAAQCRVSAFQPFKAGILGVEVQWFAVLWEAGKEAYTLSSDGPTPDIAVAGLGLMLRDRILRDEATRAEKGD